MHDHGNQHDSLKTDLLNMLYAAEVYLRNGLVSEARVVLGWYRRDYLLAPASTRRRWKCGR